MRVFFLINVCNFLLDYVYWNRRILISTYVSFRISIGNHVMYHFGFLVNLFKSPCVACLYCRCVLIYFELGLYSRFLLWELSRLVPRKGQDFALVLFTATTLSEQALTFVSHVFVPRILRCAVNFDSTLGVFSFFDNGVIILFRFIYNIVFIYSICL